MPTPPTQILLQETPSPPAIKPLKDLTIGLYFSGTPRKGNISSAARGIWLACGWPDGGQGLLAVNIQHPHIVLSCPEITFYNFEPISKIEINLQTRAEQDHYD